MHAAKTGAGDHQHTEKADEDRDQPARPRPLPEQRTREQSDQQRRREHDRDGLGQLKIFQGEEIQRGRAEKQQRAHHLQLEPAGAQDAGMADRVEQGQHQDHAAGIAGEDHLQRIDDAGEPFGAGVEQGEEQNRAAHQFDCDQPVAGRLRRKGEGGGQGPFRHA